MYFIFSLSFILSKRSAKETYIFKGNRSVAVIQKLIRHTFKCLLTFNRLKVIH